MVKIYHNPNCGTSRSVLALIRERGIEPAVVEYLKAPLTKAELKALAMRMSVAARAMVRWKQAEAVATANITENSDEEALLAAMAAHPILMNRPIVVTDKGAALCRPAQTVAALL